MKRKRVVAVAVLVVLTLAVLTALGSCQNLKHVDGSEFLQRAESIGNPWTDSKLIGATNVDVYLESGVLNPLAGWRKIVYWTELANLPAEIVAKLRAGTNPWKEGADPGSHAADQKSNSRPAR